MGRGSGSRNYKYGAFLRAGPSRHAFWELLNIEKTGKKYRVWCKVCLIFKAVLAKRFNGF